MYCAFLLLRCNNEDVKRLQVIQNRALKIIFNLPSRHPTIDIYKTYATNVLPIVGIIYYSAMLNIKKLMIDQNKIFPKVEKTRSNRLEQYKIMPAKSRLLRDDVYVAGMKLFNDLPNEIKAINNLNSFKAATKKFLLAKVESLLNDSQFILRKL